MNETNEQLLPCAFCGGEREALFIHSDDYVTCMDCGADGPCESNRDDAIAAWNRRAASNPASPAQVDFEQNEITAAFDAHHEFYEFPSQALRGGALNEWTWGWWAGARAERAKSAAVPASPAPVAAIKTWQERCDWWSERSSTKLMVEAMKAEIADLRAALAAAAPAAPSQDATCKWTYSERDHAWSSACGELWVFIDGGEPAEHGMKFCHGCGQRLDVATSPAAGAADAEGA